MTKKSLLLPLILCLLFFSAHGQQEQYPNMAIKFAPLNIIGGNAPLCFEREFHNFGLLIGAGPTFRRFLGDAFMGSGKDNGDEVYSWGKKDDLFNVKNPFDNFEPGRMVKYDLGYYVVAAPRYYIDEEGMDGRYIGLHLAAMRYNYRSKNYDESAYDKAGYDKYTDLMIVWGSQYHGDLFVFEWFGGIGARFRNQQRYAFGYDDKGDLVEGNASIKKTVLHYDFGVRIGVIF